MPPRPSSAERVGTKQVNTVHAGWAAAMRSMFGSMRASQGVC